MNVPEYALELLLAYDGQTHYLVSGYFLKLDVRVVEKSELVPHGIAYSLTLHDPDDTRILGFDNAHPVPHPGGLFIKPKVEADHCHRTRDDDGRPDDFVSVEQLL
ncbi:MAG: DUF6516 family protein, partial [Sulfurimicrobium sp.]|nr:DUF6516 family protein [Sulfurimicrobium sp.]